MMAADSLRSGVPPSLLFRLPLPCRRAGHMCAFVSRFAQPSAQLSSVQASCLERARPMAVNAFAGGRVASSTAPPGRRGLEHKRQAKAEGKTKGGGTCSPATSVCTWGRSSTARLRRRAVHVVQRAPMQVCPRASHDRTRQSLQGERP
ncbi:hypothetical protein DBA97_13130 [Pseudomonas aeruginosa]|nr:hypothetical protein CD799_22220 [Pseudomonas aeruginosa]AVZ19205.1 hypothetical protein DBA97_13130 [Pseudomonas aeruginosa]